MAEVKELGDYGATYAVSDAYLAEYLRQCMIGPPCSIELYDGSLVHDHVQRYTVRRIKGNELIAIILFKESPLVPVRLMAFKGNRVNCGCWLRAYGVPVLRVGAVQGQ